MNVSGNSFIFMTVLLLIYCSGGICLSKIQSKYLNQHQREHEEMHDRSKRFIFLKTSGIGVSCIVPAYLFEAELHQFNSFCR